MNDIDWLLMLGSEGRRAIQRRTDDLLRQTGRRLSMLKSRQKYARSNR